ncbi:MAG: sigma-70 family RNA polymerase sigma factor [Pseudomonadota bacterium]
MFDQEDQLVIALKNGENEAYQFLLSKHGGMMLSVARRYLRAEDDAKECVQEAVMLIYRKISLFKGEGAFMGWVRRIIVNQALTLLRKRKSSKTDYFDDIMPKFDDTGHRMEDRFMCDAPTQDELYERSQDVALIRRAIDAMPDDYRIILLLRDIEEYNTSECAKMLDITEQNVKTRLHRARAALRHYFLSFDTKEVSVNTEVLRGQRAC